MAIKIQILEHLRLRFDEASISAGLGVKINVCASVLSADALGGCLLALQGCIAI
jgi:hypothetical protein